MESKICPTCQELKELTEYYDSIKKDGSIYHRRECKNCVNIRAKEWRKNNLDRSNEINKKYFEKPEMVQYFIDKSIRQRKSGYALEWQRSNPDKLKVYGESHNEHIISKKEWNDCKQYFNNECAYCGLKLEDHYYTRLGITKNGDFHKEHVIHGGSNYIDNCIPSCGRCNSSKHTALLEDWYSVHNPNYTEDRYKKIIQWTTIDYIQYIKVRKQLAGK
ncbi:MAG TPA: HNH endonuclease signature motif containing protein [Clostridium sp.]|uniref:HNH endonuclease n=1 Tax=Clostridium sp. TaxID=1506 RepID=UPI002F9267B6